MLRYDKITHKGREFHFPSPITRNKLVQDMSLRQARDKGLTYYISNSLFGYDHHGNDKYPNQRSTRGQVCAIRRTDDRKEWFGALNFVVPQNSPNGFNGNSTIQIIGYKSQFLNWRIFKDDLNKTYESGGNNSREELIENTSVLPMNNPESNKLAEELTDEDRRNMMIEDSILEIYQNTGFVDQHGIMWPDEESLLDCGYGRNEYRICNQH